MKTAIAIEYIRWLTEERAKINRVPLDEIEFYEEGMVVKLSPDVIENWQDTGLNNIDFITSGEYKKAVTK